VKGKVEMAETRKVIIDTVDVVERRPFLFFDFDRIQVAPRSLPKEDEYRSLSVSEKQIVLKKLINRIKAL
jgi:hypothetical protein